MVGNTYPYSLDNWKEDIALAHGHELDGFVLNVGKEDWQRERVADCLAAASELKLPFRFFLSFDMSSFPATNPQDVGLLCAYLTAFAQHPYMLVYRGRVVVSTFAGESSFYGYSTLNEAWNFAKQSMDTITPIHFLPSFFVDTATFPSLTSMDGAFNWNGGWPVHLNPKCTRREIELPEFRSDGGYINHLRGLTYMAAVSPWFFTHYGPDTWNKNWVYRCDDWLFVRRWEHLIRIRKDVDIVQVISWNDYGESHYIGPIKGAQPNSEAWVNGYPHTAWLPLNAYFAKWFKEGHEPLIQRDRIFLWGRPHCKDVPTEDQVPRPDNWELTDDRFWIITFTTAPAKVKLFTDEKHRQSFEVGAGVSRLSFRLQPGRGIWARIKRKGKVVAECRPEGFRVAREPHCYNFNAFVCMSN